MLLNSTPGWSLPDGLTCMPNKATLYSLDTYFWDGWEDLVDTAGVAALELARAHSLVLLRPDVIALRKADLVIDWLPVHGFRLVAAMPILLDRHQIRTLWQYQCNVGLREHRDTYDALLGASACLLLVIADNEGGAQVTATQRFSELKGDSDPALCRPTDLRAVLGLKTNMLSLVHSPDEAADFIREIAAFLPLRERKLLFNKMKCVVAMPISEAQEHVSALYRSAPAHALEFDKALFRILALMRAATVLGGAASGIPADCRALLALIDRIAAGIWTDWRELFLALDRYGIPYDAWDRIVIASNLGAQYAPGKQVLLEHPPREARIEFDRAVESVTIDKRFGSPIAPGLTENSDKASLYSVDTYFREGWEDVMAVAGDAAADLVSRHAMILIKPETLGSRKFDTVLEWLQKQCFSVIALTPLAVCHRQVMALWRYERNYVDRIRRDACAELFSANASQSCVLVVRSSQDSRLPTAKRVDSLRARFENASLLLSLVHLADEPADLVREMAILLSHEQRMEIYSQMRDGLSALGNELCVLGDGLSEAITPHSIDFQNALQRIENMVRASADMKIVDRETATAIFARGATGSLADWRELFDLLDYCGVQYNLWDRLTIATHTLNHSLNHTLNYTLNNASSHASNHASSHASNHTSSYTSNLASNHTLNISSSHPNSLQPDSIGDGSLSLQLPPSL